MILHVNFRVIFNGGESHMFSHGSDKFLILVISNGGSLILTNYYVQSDHFTGHERAYSIPNLKFRSSEFHTSEF